jgi:hypothetical protein
VGFRRHRDRGLAVTGLDRWPGTPFPSCRWAQIIRAGVVSAGLHRHDPRISSPENPSGPYVTQPYGRARIGFVLGVVPR